MTGIRRWIVPALLAVGLAAGIFLVVTGSDSGDEPATGTDGATGASEALDLDDTTVQGVRELTGLAVPDDAADFLTAQLDDGSQLDITFTLDPAEVPTFVEDSDLPALEEGTRVITHSSPLWELNPDGTISGATDTTDSVVRLVEFVDEDGRSRARVSVRPAP